MTTFSFSDSRDLLFSVRVKGDETEREQFSEFDRRLRDRWQVREGQM